MLVVLEVLVFVFVFEDELLFVFVLVVIVLFFIVKVEAFEYPPPDSLLKTVKKMILDYTYH